MTEPRVSWFTAFNDNHPDVYELVEAAVRSSLPFAIDRYCVCDTADEAIVATLESLGVRVLRARISFEAALEAAGPIDPAAMAIWKGTGLRLDIPRLIDRHSLPIGEHYLYTDSDVLFLRDPVPGLVALAPAWFAASGEFTQDPNPPYFNAGVMWANRRAMQASYDDLLAYLASPEGREPSGRGPFDQGLLNDFYLGRIDYLPCRYNWKPYWGFDDGAIILHWHGPKPGDIRARYQGKPMVPDYETLHALRPDLPDVYRRYLAIQEGFRPASG